MKKLLRTLIGHGHNFATRCWVLTVVAVYWFDRLLQVRPETRAELAGLNRGLYVLGLVCVVIILLAGFGRMFYPNDVKKIFDRSREKQRIRQLSKMYLILLVVLFPAMFLSSVAVDGMGTQLFAVAVLWLVIMLPLEAERSLRFRFIGARYGGDLVHLDAVWKKMMMIWHIVLLSALAAGTYFQYVIVSKS